MTWDEDTIRALKDSDVDVVSYIPDSVISDLIGRIERDEEFTTVPVAREEEAIAIVSGAWLGGQRGAVVCQSSGLANTINALGSLSKPWGLPFVGVVSRRGNLGEYNLAQVAAGYGMPDILDAVGIRHCPLDEGDDVAKTIRMAADTAFQTHEPYIVLTERRLTEGSE